MSANSTMSKLFVSLIKSLNKKTISFIVMLSFISGLLGILYAFYQKPMYESKLTFALDEGGSSESGGLAGLAAQFGFGMVSNDVFGGDNIAEIMRSRRVIERVLLSVDSVNRPKITMADWYTEIVRKYVKIKKGQKSIKFPVGVNKLKFNYVQDSALFAMYKDLYLKLKIDRPDKKLNIFEIKFRSLDEKFTKVFTDKIVKETQDFYTELRTQKSKQTLAVLEGRVEAMKGGLNSSISSKASVQDANLNPAFAQAQVPIQKQQINIQAYGGAYAELYKNMELARYQLLKDVPLFQIIDPADYPMKKVKLGKATTGILFTLITGILCLTAVWLIAYFKSDLSLLLKSSSEKEN